MANCYMCGRTDRDEEIVLEKRVFRGEHRLMCEDRDECHDYCRDSAEPQDIEDTPCLDEPWWRYR